MLAGLRHTSEGMTLAVDTKRSIVIVHLDSPFSAFITTAPSSSVFDMVLAKRLQRPQVDRSA